MKPGSVVITEANWKSWISRGIAKATKSKWTHCFIVTGPDEAVEGTFPRAKKFKLSARLAELKAQKRDYVVFDHPDNTLQRRWRLTATARSWVGKWYDVGQILIYLFTGRFHKDGIGTVVCSRMVTGVYASIGVKLFDEEALKNLPEDYLRKNNLRDQMAVPDDFFRSKLVVVEEVDN